MRGDVCLEDSLLRKLVNIRPWLNGVLSSNVVSLSLTLRGRPDRNRRLYERSVWAAEMLEFDESCVEIWSSVPAGSLPPTFCYHQVVRMDTGKSFFLRLRLVTSIRRKYHR
jgi:hypothetical protein